MSAAVALCYSGAAGFHGAVSAPARQRSVVMETKAELVDLAKQLNPVVGYWDPLKLADRNFWNQGEEVSTGPCCGRRGGVAELGAQGRARCGCSARGAEGCAAAPRSPRSAPRAQRRQACAARCRTGCGGAGGSRRARWRHSAALPPAKLPAARLG